MDPFHSWKTSLPSKRRLVKQGPGRWLKAWLSKSCELSPRGPVLPPVTDRTPVSSPICPGRCSCWPLVSLCSCSVQSLGLSKSSLSFASVPYFIYSCPFPHRAFYALHCYNDVPPYLLSSLALGPAQWHGARNVAIFVH